jgi:hypothetical protein
MQPGLNCGSQPVYSLSLPLLPWRLCTAEKGYAVTLLVDARLEDMQRGVRVLRGSLSPGDTVVVFYSGHGMQFEGKNFLIPVDVDMSSAAGMLVTLAHTRCPALFCFIGPVRKCSCCSLQLMTRDTGHLNQRDT